MFFMLPLFLFFASFHPFPSPIDRPARNQARPGFRTSFQEIPAPEPVPITCRIINGRTVCGHGDFPAPPTPVDR